MSPPRPTLEVGYVARVHGLQGELAVRTFDRDSEALSSVRRIVVRLRSGEERDMAVESARRASDATLVSLAGVTSRSAAEAFKGATVLVHREDLPPPAEGEWFQGDLVGLEVRTPDGTPLGRVTEVWNTGPVPNLVIEGTGPEPLVVPFVDEFVPEVDVKAGVLVVRPPEMLE
ncbi:MAG TPA: ribosome maturation factor RimM [Myxococcaceae bacterium]|nr:ribosome maturation factor RimM [Myxococcaceae bacterium]